MSCEGQEKWHNSHKNGTFPLQVEGGTANLTDVLKVLTTSVAAVAAVEALQAVNKNLKGALKKPV